jgi:hypothetical protein
MKEKKKRKITTDGTDTYGQRRGRVTTNLTNHTNGKKDTIYIHLRKGHLIHSPGVLGEGEAQLRLRLG